MAGVVELARWRREHAPWEEDHERLDEAVDRLDGLLADQPWHQPPGWVLTELLAVQGCLSMGLATEAALRCERLSERIERMARRVGRAR